MFFGWLPAHKGDSNYETIIIATSLVLVATSVFAQSATEATGVNSALGVAPTTEDFIMQASASDVRN